MMVLAWIVAACVVLCPLAWLCDNWPTRTADQQSVDRFAIYRRNLADHERRSFR